MQFVHRFHDHHTPYRSMLSRFDRKGNAGFALTELAVRFFDQNDGNDGGEDIGCRHGANNTVRPKPDGEQRAAAAEKAERREGKARPAACVLLGCV